MNGSLYEQNGKYYMTICYKNEQGRWRQKKRATGLNVKGNKKKAQKLLNDYLLENSNRDFYKCDVLLVEYLKKWFEYGNQNIDQITKEGYQNYLFKHIIPYFEPLKLKIEQVKPKHIVAYYNYKATKGRLDGKSGGISASSLRKHSFILNKALNQARIEELIVRNPAEKVPIPKMESKEKVWKFMNAAEANKVLEVMEGHILKPMVIVTLYYGLRKSEVLGLKWNAIDFENETLEIKHTVVKCSSIIAKDKTKNRASKRKYKLLSEVKEMLKNLRIQKEENREFFGKEYFESDYIFTWQDGRLIRPDYITPAFQKVLKKHNLPKYRFHDLRHSCASILFDKGWSAKEIQEWLGHADIETTLGIYTHISNLRKEILAKDLEGTFSLVAG